MHTGIIPLIWSIFGGQNRGPKNGLQSIFARENFAKSAKTQSTDNSGYKEHVCPG